MIDELLPVYAQRLNPLAERQRPPAGHRAVRGLYHGITTGSRPGRRPEIAEAPHPSEEVPLSPLRCPPCLECLDILVRPEDQRVHTCRSAFEDLRLAPYLGWPVPSVYGAVGHDDRLEAQVVGGLESGQLVRNIEEPDIEIAPLLRTGCGIGQFDELGLPQYEDLDKPSAHDTQGIRSHGHAILAVRQRSCACLRDGESPTQGQVIAGARGAIDLVQSREELTIDQREGRLGGLVYRDGVFVLASNLAETLFGRLRGTRLRYRGPGGYRQQYAETPSHALHASIPYFSSL